MEELRRVIRTLPVIDNHAHNLLRPQQLRSGDLLSATSEAEGEALQDGAKALPHLRAARQLKQLYGLPEDTDWDNTLRKRRELLDADPRALIQRCLAGTHTILIDDGLEGSFERYNWHDQFTTTPSKRIVRIEAVAADILSSLHQQGKLPTGVAISDKEACSRAWVTFVTSFEKTLAAASMDKDVVGFKSVVCYRSGLNVTVGRDVDVTNTGLASFRQEFLPRCTQTKFRVESKGMNDAIVIIACKLIDATLRSQGTAKPLQFHTGLGDNDISLLTSNPAYLQPLIKAFPNVPIVLLHSAWPYTREAGYLATVYKHVYLDLGEVFPMVSRDGQEQIIRQALEITPTSKLLWSTDGHHHPETYWLANLQMREVLETVFCKFVEANDLTSVQAIDAVKDILFRNSNFLYNLHLEVPAMTPSEVPITSALKSSSDDFPIPQATLLSLREPATQQPQEILGIHAMQGAQAYRLDALERAIAQLDSSTSRPNEQTPIPTRRGVQFVFIQWLDYMAQLRSRWLPISEFERLMRSGSGRISISKGNLGTTQNDHLSSICNPVGSIYVEPDLRSFRPIQDTGPVKNTACVMATFTNDDGSGLTTCPRYTLQRTAEAFEEEYGFHFLVGFEIEVTFCRRNEGASEDMFSPLDSTHAWGTFTDEQYMHAVSLMTSIATCLQDIGIKVEQLHSEAGAGQYEFVLPPQPPLQAVDTLIQARQCIQQIAATKGLRATYHPMPFPGIGTAAHAHISFNSGQISAVEIEKTEQSFIASVLDHLPAICAITMPQAVSYNRVVDDSWTGGTWVAWGTNNREVPLRKVTSERWEIRCLDGTANMYLALAVILGAGLGGLRQSMTLQIQDCLSNPTKLSNEEKQALGITRRMPRSLDEALEAIENDTVFAEMANPELIHDWIQVKKAEQEMLNEMTESERRIWLMERY